MTHDNLCKLCGHDARDHRRIYRSYGLMCCLKCECSIRDNKICQINDGFEENNVAPVKNRFKPEVIT